MGTVATKEPLRKADAELLTILMRPEVKARLESLASLLGTSMSTLARWAIEEYLARQLGAKPNRQAN